MGGIKFLVKSFLNVKDRYSKLAKILSVLGILLLGSIILSNAASADHITNTTQNNHYINCTNQSQNAGYPTNITELNQTYSYGKSDSMVNETNAMTAESTKSHNITHNTSKLTSSNGLDYDHGVSSPPDLLTAFSKSVDTAVKYSENSRGSIFNFLEYSFLFGYVAMFSFFIIKWIYY